MSTKSCELEFDPGFAPYILAFQGTIEYLYTDINRFKNLSQKKAKFMQYYKKILEVFYNNVGFYTGCLMWASYIKSQPKAKISSNSFFNTEYNEEENVSDINYVIKFAELFPKDVKYFLGHDFKFKEEIINLLNIYKEFLMLNKGFTETEYNVDIILPSSIKEKNVENYKNMVDSAIKSQNLAQLSENILEII